MNEIIAGEERFFRAASSDAETIQNAVDSACGEKTVIRVPRWNPRTEKPEWRIDRDIVLKTNVTIILDNAALVQETGSFNRIFTAERGAKNIAVIGEGNATLSGGEESRLNALSSGKYGLPDVSVNGIAYFSGVSGLTIRNLTIENMRWVAVSVLDSEDVSISNLNFVSIPRVVREHGVCITNCKRVSIENVSGRTGASTVIVEANKNGETSGVSIRNLKADPARGSVLSIRTRENGTVSDVTANTVIDSSKYYEKARSASALVFGDMKPVIPGPVVNRSEFFEKRMPAAEAIRNVFATNLYSRSNYAVEILQPFSDTVIGSLITYGDNIYAIGSRSSDEMELKNVVFERVFYGAGSEPNNLKAFIARYAKGATAVKTPNIQGYTVKQLVLQEEEP